MSAWWYLGLMVVLIVAAFVYMDRKWSAYQAAMNAACDCPGCASAALGELVDDAEADLDYAAHVSAALRLVQPNNVTPFVPRQREAGERS